MWVKIHFFYKIYSKSVPILDSKSTNKRFLLNSDFTALLKTKSSSVNNLKLNLVFIWISIKIRKNFYRRLFGWTHGEKKKLKKFYLIEKHVILIFLISDFN